MATLDRYRPILPEHLTNAERRHRLDLLTRYLERLITLEETLPGSITIKSIPLILSLLSTSTKKLAIFDSQCIPSVSAATRASDLPQARLIQSFPYYADSQIPEYSPEGKFMAHSAADNIFRLNRLGFRIPPSTWALLPIETQCLRLSMSKLEHALPIEPFNCQPACSNIHFAVDGQGFITDENGESFWLTKDMPIDYQSHILNHIYPHASKVVVALGCSATTIFDSDIVRFMALYNQLTQSSFTSQFSQKWGVNSKDAELICRDLLMKFLEIEQRVVQGSFTMVMNVNMSGWSFNQRTPLPSQSGLLVNWLDPEMQPRIESAHLSHDGIDEPEVGSHTSAMTREDTNTFLAGVPPLSWNFWDIMKRRLVNQEYLDLLNSGSTTPILDLLNKQLNLLRRYSLADQIQSSRNQAK